jgi:hypothetical protein
MHALTGQVTHILRIPTGFAAKPIFFGRGAGAGRVFAFLGIHGFAPRWNHRTHLCFRARDFDSLARCKCDAAPSHKVDVVLRPGPRASNHPEEMPMPRMRGVFVSLVCCFAVIASGCHRGQPDNSALKTAINRYYSAHPACVWENSVKFPIQADASGI